MIHLDYETYSPLDLTEVGVFRYAEHPEAEILMAAVATETEGPYLLVNPKWEGVRPSDPQARKLFESGIQTEPYTPVDEIWAHNAQFEFAVTSALLERQFALPRPPIEAWRCTALLCRRAGLPAKLEKACEVLKLPHQKDARGKALIRKFSMPNPKTGKRTLPTDDPEAFREFCEYCLQDVRAERALHAALKPFTPTGELLDAFTWDLKLNARGFPVDVPALRAAQKIIVEVRAEVGGEFNRITGLAPSQRQKCLDWFNAQGLALANMQSATVTEALAKYAGHVAYEPLRLYSLVQSAAVDKVQTMLDCRCADDRVRGGLQFYGASTGRWSGRLVQPQNFKKPRKAHADLTGAFYADLRSGMARSEAELLYGPPVDWIASSIRHFLSGPLLDADYAAIEARIVAWLAGQENLLRVFRGDGKVYEWMGSMIFGVPADKIKNPSTERDAGKVGVLGCGYQMWWPKLQVWAKSQYNITLDDAMAEKIVLGYREACSKVVDLWATLDHTARAAIVNPGTTYRVNKYLTYTVRKVGDVPFLIGKLPSGRSLAYPWPALEADPRREGKTGISFFGNIKGETWGRVFTFGGSLLENFVQAIAFDLMAHGGLVAERAGFEIVNLIHDQALALLRTGQTTGQFAKCLTDLPVWAAGLPLKAEAKVTPYYKK